MIKVAYLVSTVKKSGPINVLYNIVKYLDKNKFKVYIISLSPTKKNSKEDEFRECGCEIVNLNLNRIEGIIKAKKIIEKLIINNDIDIIHGHGIRPDNIISKISGKYRVKTCSTLHNYPYYDYVMTYGKIKGYLMAKCHLKYLKNIDISNACSKSVSEMLMERNGYKIDYIQNGVDLQNYFIVDDKEKIELKNKLNLPIDKKIFISVGHLSSRKDPLTIIKAFEGISDCILIFLGDGHLKQQCLEKIEGNKNIRVIGFVSNVKEYLQASDYFISASRAEGLPNTVMEAMACGLPVILSNIKPHEEIISFNKHAGLLFEAGNYVELKNKINNIKLLNYKKLSRNANEIILKNLNAEIMSRNYEYVYES